jgi:lysozyme
MGMKTSPNGISFIEAWEGCRLVAYQDIVGVWTIGVGHTGSDVVRGKRITQAEADAILAADLAKFERTINAEVRVPITQNQFDALVSLAFNIGSGAFRSSTLLRKLNGGDIGGAAKAFLSWNHAGGRVSAGLTKRREAEMNLFNR